MVMQPGIISPPVRGITTVPVRILPPPTTTTVPAYTYTIPKQPTICQSIPKTTSAITPVSDSCQSILNQDNSSQASVPETSISNASALLETSSINWGIFVILGILVIIMLIVVK